TAAHRGRLPLWLGIQSLGRNIVNPADRALDDGPRNLGRCGCVFAHAALALTLSKTSLTYSSQRSRQPSGISAIRLALALRYTCTSSVVWQCFNPSANSFQSLSL